MMKLRCSRLYQKRIIPSSRVNRFISTAGRPTETIHNPFKHRTTAQTITIVPRIPNSPVHPLLGEGYEVGGKLTRVDPQMQNPVLDLDGRPTWGTRTIGTKFYAPKGDQVFHM